MGLADRVRVTQRYQRAVRLDTDIGNSAALDGFVCPKSSAEMLEVMAHHVAQSGQGAFTWTGPYGSGKSSLAVVLSAALASHKDFRHRCRMEEILGQKTLNQLADALPPGNRGWQALPVIGRRDYPAQVIGEAIRQAGLLKGRGPKVWTEKRVLDTLAKISTSKSPKASGGLIVFIDEMGKFLEAAAHDEFDIYLFQQLAELSSRSGGRLIVVGILHQAFEEYAHRLSGEMRDEWAKIQGRFVDLAVNTVGGEQIDLLGRAIDSDHRPKRPGSLATNVAALVQGETSTHLATMLENCWPLHPITACLLGPVSRRRFGQNQRSIFGFLNSAEPLGFRDFINSADDNTLYGPERLWDYMHINLESSILASPDGHRWALATESIRRCEIAGGGDLHLRLLKMIAIVDLFKDRSGIVASRALIKLALSSHGDAAVSSALKDLLGWSTVVYRKFTSAYAIFEGSDFNIDAAVQKVRINAGLADLSRINQIASVQPIVAKRHYHETGALRWFEVKVAPLSEIHNIVDCYIPNHGAIGGFFLVIPTQGESLEDAMRMCKNAARRSRDDQIVLGISEHAWKIPDLAMELTTLERVRDETPDLHGDRVARSEVTARIAGLQGHFESELERAFSRASWYYGPQKAKLLSLTELNILASNLAQKQFDCAPIIHNELLCRVKPSSSAIAARNALLRRMIFNEGEARLGIEGFPAEGGLFVSLLKNTGLYRKTFAGKTFTGWRIEGPRAANSDICNLGPMWEAAESFLKENMNRSVSLTEIYDIWRDAPFGIKDGLLPVFAVAFILSRNKTLAVYRQRIFQTEISELTIDYLTQDPGGIHLRWVDLSGVSQQLVLGLIDILRNFGIDVNDSQPRPIDVARALVSIYDGFPRWVGSTQSLSDNAKKIRHMFKQANDPNKLIFDDMPKVLNEGETIQEVETVLQIINRIDEGLKELQQAYPATLDRIRKTLLAELRVLDGSAEMIAVLRDRAANIRELGGDHRLEAFIIRLAQFEGHDTDIESLAGMAINKSPQDWVDSDIDRVLVELAELAQRFIRVEAYAHVKGRSSKRHAMAVVVGIGGCPQLVHDEFDITEMDRPRVTMLLERVEAALNEAGAELPRNIILATLAEMSARHLSDNTADKPVGDPPQNRIER